MQRNDLLSALDGFLDDGSITAIVREVKSGKEATVFQCRRDDTLIAAKVHRPIETRKFRNDAAYQGGRVAFAHDTRIRRALQSKSAFGKNVQFGTWLHHEWEMLRRLHRAGLDVPEPIAIGERAMLMTWLGDEDVAAPGLFEADLTRDEAADAVDALVEMIEVMLDLHVVHGDLSPYNILYWDGRPVIIDFPQAVDPRLNDNAANILRRDLDNVCGWAKRHGVDRDAGGIWVDLWSRFVEGRLG